MVNKSQALDPVFKALADATRRSVVVAVAQRPCRISDLAVAHDMTLAGMLKHVGILERAGLVATTKQGRERFCISGSESGDVVSEWLSAYRRRWQARIDELEAFLDSASADDPA